MERQGLDLGLSLGLGLTTAATWPAAGFCLNSGMAEQEVIRRDDVVAAAAAEDERFACSPGSPVSSGSGKRGSGSGSGDEVDDAGCDVGGGGGGGARKKLRLSKDQAAVLEECFKTHHTLTPKQKVALAKSLNLRPRQVEVWFQNRRARTKLKQTEVDCEHLKRWCDQLADDNRRLHKELAELRALKATPTPPAAAPPLTTLTMCLSCKRVANAGVPSPAAAMFPGHPQFLCGFRDHAGAASSSYGGASSGLAKGVRAAR
ncbi:homeobox-leucine zipper protein HOX28 [Oryza glaberrima]|uniref:homeobox-leucine zipper protein HOX28 n=1 Tax=Oryza glaberrima TaxID=4538 RepID=UPI00224C359B|nr:homeobox-leucine zipper protein HOX28 [Oryza glaberrima]